VNKPNNVRQYDLFKLIVAIVLLLLFLILFFGTGAQKPDQQSESTPLPTLTSDSSAQAPVSATATSSPTTSPTVTQTPSPTNTPTDTPTPTVSPAPTQQSSDSTDDEVSVDVSTCEEIAKSQLQTGMTARVLQRLNFRSSPEIKSNRILTHSPEALAEIIGGPICTRYSNGGAYLWWQLELPNGLVGWSAESSIFGDYYFMEPVP